MKVSPMSQGARLCYTSMEPLAPARGKKAHAQSAAQGSQRAGVSRFTIGQKTTVNSGAWRGSSLQSDEKGARPCCGCSNPTPSAKLRSRMFVNVQERQ